jgi:thiamine-monophosphate kinase
MTPLNKEQKLIAKIKTMVDAGGFIGDDSAVLPGGLLVTADTLVEQTHFNLNWTALSELGWKAMAVNLSDIAAMAGIPKYALIVISAPEEFYGAEKIISLYEGLNDCAQRYKTAIVGGDISCGPNLTITVTIIGQAQEAGVLLRNGAKPGDAIIVTGDFGASRAGLRICQDSLTKDALLRYKHCLKEFLTPNPKLAESWRLVERIGSRGALMDTSDGLADAFLQVSQASNVGMQIDLNAIPVSEQTKKYASEVKTDPLDFALYGGEDYQLLACLSAEEWLSWQTESPDIKNSFKQIGNVTNTADVQLMFGNEKAYQLDPARIFKHIS